jgi:hypothetical protein
LVVPADDAGVCVCDGANVVRDEDDDDDADDEGDDDDDDGDDVDGNGLA